MLLVYVIQRWTATGASYQFVLFPIVSVIGGALLLGEDVTSSLLLGAPFVLVGVYIGALSRSEAPDQEVASVDQQTCPSSFSDLG